MADDEGDAGANSIPDLPIPISYISDRYFLFDIKAVSYLRREHNLCGYNIGTLPQSPSQNVFLGLPTLIMPEEAQLLIDKHLGHLVDDARAHDQAVYDRNKARKADFVAKVQRQAREVETLRAQEQETGRRKALSRKTNNANPRDTNEEPIQPNSLLSFDDEEENHPPPSSTTPQNQETPIKAPTTPSSQNYHITPTTSLLLLPPSPPTPQSTKPTQTPTHPIPNLPSSYPLFHHLHSCGYFLTPGLRFGCQYSVYPGDPLRFHSHFLAVGVEWEQEIDLMQIVGGGRLGTGVKKGFLIGGEEKVERVKEKEEGKVLQNHAEGRGDDDDMGTMSAQSNDDRETTQLPTVRTFSVEWAVM